jgi:hypothetical protein
MQQQVGSERGGFEPTFAITRAELNKTRELGGSCKRGTGLKAVALPPWLIDGWLVVGRAGDVHFLCHLVMARLAHVIRFRCEVIALTRFVTVRLGWALTLHCFGSSQVVASVPESPNP